MTPLCTIGYERFTNEQWLDSLVAHRIQTVVDVREMPLSRKAGFSKTKLSEALAARGIEYVHLKALGNPKTYRDRLREGWDFDEFEGKYAEILERESEAVAMLTALTESRRVCLVCFEEDPARCHRSIVAEYLARWMPNLRVSHLRYA